MKHLYSDTIYNKKIIICGPVPPPYGGVAVHIKRIQEKLRNQDNIVIIFDASAYISRLQRWCNLITCLYKNKFTLIYYHTLYNSIIEWLLVFIYSKIFNVTLHLVDHDCEHLDRRSKLELFIFKNSIHRINKHTIIGTSTHASYQKHAIKIIKETALESPFLPPVLMHKEELISSYSPQLHMFLNTKSPRILMNAAQALLTPAGHDVYGILDSLRLLQKLQHLFPNIGLCIALGHRGNLSYFEKLISFIKNNNLEHAVYFFEEQKELWPLFEYCNLFIRPTLYDSYGISIEEALFFGIPALATDVCKRPAGTLLYQYGDFEDLYEKSKKILEETYGNNKHYSVYLQQAQ